MTYVQATKPAGYPVSLEEIKDHLKISYTEEDYLLTIFIGAATEYAESITRRALMSRSFDYYLDEFPEHCCIELPMPALQSVTSIKYYDTSNVLQTLSSSKYQVDIKNEPGRIVLTEGEIWPSTKTRKPNAVEIRYVAGYPHRGEIPKTIKTAILLTVGHWFENRESVVVGPTGLRIKDVPLSANFLLDQNRVMSFF